MRNNLHPIFVELLGPVMRQPAVIRRATLAPLDRDAWNDAVDRDRETGDHDMHSRDEIDERNGRGL